ncbi:hypothetical protein E8E11_000135 [Didymella keratinophila]|nr:hypothetical protein E8E11_000135 [Didymella keratinophila]
MPPRVHAGSQSLQGLQDHVAESTASPTQRDKENIPLPVLQEVKIVYDTKYVLDCQGSKRFDRGANDQQYYIGQPEDPSPSYLDFPMPGQESADTLRDFLRRNLRPDQVVDEHGTQCEITASSNDHLPVLQAKLWAKIPGSRSLVKASTQRPSRSQNLIAGHVSKISQFLEKKHVFVIREDIKDLGCDYMEDLQTTGTPICQSLKIRLEPLVNWGTTTPALPSGPVLPFRRNGELMTNMGKPEYILYTRSLTNIDTPSYCTDCLDYLWSKRGEARDTIRQLQETVSRPQYRFPEDSTVPRPVLKRKQSCSRSTDAGSLAVGGALSTTATLIDAVVDEPDEPLDKALSQLDGPSTKPGNAKEKENTSGNPEKNNPGPEIIDLITPPRTKERKFGQELDTNIKAPPVEVRRSPRKHKTNMFMSQAIRPAPVKPMKPLGRVQKTNATTKAAPKSIKETKKQKIAPVGEQTVKQKKPRQTDTRVAKPLVGMDSLLTNPAPQESLLSRPRLGLSSPERLQQKTIPEPAARTSSPPKLTVHFAKRPTESKLPDSVVDEEWAVFHRTHPTPTSKICFCNKPAYHGKFKKGEEPQIAQCVSKDCRFRWFHYACLDISEKGKARWGTLLCSVCRVEQELVDRDRVNGWTADRMIDFPPVWMKEDIEEQLPGLGGVMQAKPYGLGLEIQLAREYEHQIKETGTLGGLPKLGYPLSRPKKLEEAYLHAGAYAELLARRAKEDQDVDWDDGVHEEGGENSGEEL